MDTRLIPAGTAVLRCGTTPRYHLAEGCWDDLEVPSGASKLRQVGLEVAHNLNRAVERMTGDWLATIDDDHAYAPGTLLRLLRQMYERDLDVLVPLIVHKTPPYAPVLSGAELNGHGLTAVQAAGTGYMLIRRRVFDGMDEPYFRVGQLDGDLYQEDIDFCLRACGRGFRVWCDPSTPIGHITQVTVWPHVFSGGERGVFLALGNDTVLPIRPAELAVGRAVGIA